MGRRPAVAGGARDRVTRFLGELGTVDQALYQAIAQLPTPALDRRMRQLSRLADHSVLWLAIAAALAAAGGDRGRRAAVHGVAAIGVTSAMVNIGAKALYDRPRPDRLGAGMPASRQVPMPASRSFPSGHSAAGFAFASAVGSELPWLALPLRLAATAVAYSRVHTGVHYPGDAVAGSLLGASLGQAVSRSAGYAARRRAAPLPSQRRGRPVDRGPVVRRPVVRSPVVRSPVVRSPVVQTFISATIRPLSRAAVRAR